MKILELKKKAKAEAQAAKLWAQKARAAAEKFDADDEIEEDENEGVSFARKKKRSKRSQVWPWENPGIESEDETWIDGQIKEGEIDIHRFDITKGLKKRENGQHEEEGITVMSHKMHRSREERYYQVL